MEVILLERVEKLGHMGEKVNVKSGYARNFLLPKKKALRATKENLAQFEAERARLETLNGEKRAAAEIESKKLEGASVILVRQAGEAGQLYGSVSARDISDAVSETGVTVNRTQVRLETPIKTIGLFAVGISLHPEVTVAITVNVARSTDEAKTQAKTGHAIISQAEAEAAADTAQLEQLFDEVPVNLSEGEEAEVEGQEKKAE